MPEAELAVALDEAHASDASPDSQEEGPPVGRTPLRVAAAAAPNTPDPAEIRKAITLFVAQGDVVELRALHVPGYNDSRYTASGYFDADHVEDLVEAAAKFEKAPGIYITLNPVLPDLLARASNWARRVKGDPTTNDGEIARRRWLLVDLDPVRPNGISATDQEHREAQGRAREVGESLEEAGWPAPILVSSGNGAYLLYRVDLPGDDAGLVQRALEALAFRWSDDRVKVDTTVHNPARIFRLPGTVNRKGDATPDRPHRVARLLEVPDQVEVVGQELLQQLADALPRTPQSNSRRRGVPSRFDLDAWIEASGLELDEPRDWQGGRKWILPTCPWDEQHTDRAAYLLQLGNGAIAAGCHHNGCQDKGWAELRDLVEPGWREGEPEERRKAAVRTLDALVDKARQSKATVVRKVLGDPKFVPELTRAAEADADRWESTLLQLQELGVKAKEIKLLRTQIREHVREGRRVGDGQASLLDSGKTERVLSVLPGAPCSDQIVLPAGWRLGPDHTERCSTGKNGAAQILATPLVVTALHFDEIEGTERVRLSWLRDQEWRHRVVEKSVTSDARKIVGLSDFGLPVNSTNARGVVEYLAAFEAANRALLPKARVSGRMGWQGSRGARGFLLGRTLVYRNGNAVVAIDLDGVPPEDWPSDGVLFQGANQGEEQLANAFKVGGTLDEWKRAVESVATHPRALLALSAAFAPPLLEILGVDNFVVDLCGPTSTGKTTLLRVAASVWGDPDQRGQNSLLRPWNATSVGSERLFSAVNGLPTFLDDTKQARAPQQVREAIYAVGNAQGRVRGAIQGHRAVSAFRTVLFSTGEAKAVSFTPDGGTRGRVISIWGPPFGAVDQASARMIDSLREGICSNFGHAGLTFIRYLLERHAEWDAWRARYRDSVLSLRQKAGTSIVGGRVAEYAAAIRVASELAHKALDLQWVWTDPIDPLWEDLVGESTDADRADDALRLVLGWCRSNPARMCSASGGAPFQGWAGRWLDGKDAGGGEPEDYVALVKFALDGLLVEHGFESEAVVRTWFDKGYLSVGNDRARRQKQVRIDGRRQWAIVIRRDAVKAVEGVAPDDELGRRPVPRPSTPELPIDDDDAVVL